MQGATNIWPIAIILIGRREGMAYAIVFRPCLYEGVSSKVFHWYDYEKCETVKKGG